MMDQTGLHVFLLEIHPGSGTGFLDSIDSLASYKGRGILAESDRRLPSP